MHDRNSRCEAMNEASIAYYCQMTSQVFQAMLPILKKRFTEKLSFTFIP